MARVLKPCGTPAAYQRHRRHYEPRCDKCAKAEADRSRAYRAEVKRILRRATGAQR